MAPTSFSTQLRRTGVSDAGGQDRTRKTPKLSWTAPSPRLAASPPCKRSSRTSTLRKNAPLLQITLFLLKQSQVKRTWIPSSMLECTKAKRRLLPSALSLEGRACQMLVGRIEREEYRNYHGPRPLLAWRHHRPAKEAAERPPAWTDRNGAAVERT